jgi:hypothetical protein
MKQDGKPPRFRIKKIQPLVSLRLGRVLATVGVAKFVSNQLGTSKL